MTHGIEGGAAFNEDQRDSMRHDALVISGIFTTANEAMLLAQLKGGDLEDIRQSVESDPYWKRFCQIAKEGRPIDARVPVERMILGWAQREGK